MKSSLIKSPVRFLVFLFGLALMAGITWQMLQKEKPTTASPSAPTASPSAPVAAIGNQPIVVPPSNLADQSSFGVPILSVGSQSPSATHQSSLEALSARFTAMGGRENPETAKLIGDYLSRETSSPYALSLLQEKAAIEWKHGFFTSSLESIRQAWAVGSELQDINERRLAEAALTTLLNTLSGMGSREDLRSTISSIKNRPLGGAATEALYRAKEQLWFFDNQPEQNVFCGFTAANSVVTDTPPIFPDVHDETEKQAFIASGLSLYELRAHNHEAGGDFKSYKSTAKATPPVPSVVHAT